jgi:uncharacterized sulfatase
MAFLMKTQFIMKFSCLLILSFVLGLPQSGWARDVKPSVPNILIILADDLHWRDLGATGNPDVYTPNIDQLALDGLRLNGFFASSTVCSPLRHSLYTGLYPVRSGAYPNHTRVDPETRSVFHHLSELGYRVGLLGKTHISPAVSFPFENISSRAKDFDKAAAFINRDRQQPWFMVFASNEPHAPWHSGPRERYDADKLSLPPWLHDNPVTRSTLADYYAEISDLDAQVGTLLKLIEEADQESATMVWFFSEQGSQLPYGGKWSLYDNGIRVAGFVRWPGRIQPGSSADALLQYVDVVPTLVEIAGGNPQSVDTGQAGAADGNRGFDGHSFFPVLNGDRSAHREYVFAQNTTVGVYGYREPYPSRSVRDERYKLIRNLASENEFWINGIHNHPVYKSWQEEAASDPWLAEQVKWLSHRPAVELYDLRHDTFEKNNVAGQAEYAKIETRLGKALDHWMLQQGDLGIETELKARSRQAPGLDQIIKNKGISK